MTRIQLLLSTSVLGCAILVQPAFAQNASARAAASASNQPSADSQTVQEVVVTAERRTSTAQKTAASISVRSGSDMLNEGRYELKNIIEDVPGITGGAATNTGTALGSGTDNPARGLVIRGVQSNTGAGGSVTTTAAAAAIYVDDVYNGIGGGYDIDRVEVLRGPQGTLYGRSATAGVVAIHTGDPNPAARSGQAAAEFGNYDMRHLTGDVNLPVIQDKLAVRLSGNEYERDGYYSADGGAVASADFRAKALWTPTDNFSALLGYAQEYDVTHSGGVTINQVGSPTNFVYTKQEVASGKNNFHQYWANFNLNLGPVAITYIPAYRTWYQNATTYLRGGFNANQTIYTPTDWFMTHELRIHNTDNDAKLKWQAGFTYYGNTLSDVNNLFSLPAGPYLFKSSSHKTTTAEGGFAEATYAFMPDTRLTAGVRYDHTQVRDEGSYTSILGITKTLTGDQGLRTFNNLTYKVRLEHDLTPRNLVYAAVSTGFSPGDVVLTTDQNYQPAVQELKSETLTAYEIGSKNRFLDDRLQVNGDVFYNDYGGYQTAGIDISSLQPPPPPPPPPPPGSPPAPPATPQPTFQTLASPMKSYGAELEVVTRPWANGTISFNASYTNARYGSFGALYDTLFYRKEVPSVPPFQGSVAYDHRLALGDATLLLHGAVRFFTAHDTSSLPQSLVAEGAGDIHVASQSVGDLNATLLIGPHYSITAYVRNVADNRFIPDGWAVTKLGPTLSSNGTALSDPRTFGVILSFKY
jgi:outer membrane receptor protein involved in Fe transport